MIKMASPPSTNDMNPSKPAPLAIKDNNKKSPFVKTRTTTMPNNKLAKQKTVSNDRLFIGISGLIGAGKTTLAKALGKVLDLPVYLEPVTDNCYLEDFYKNMLKYSFPMHVFLLNKRYRQHQQIIWGSTGGVQDRTIYEDGVFAQMHYNRGTMLERDYETYKELVQTMANFMKKPNIIVHLDLSPEESLRRIRMRGRSCEAGITIEYLRDLHAAYEEFVDEIARVIPVIKVDYQRFRTAEQMAFVIKKEYEKIANARSVNFSDDEEEEEVEKQDKEIIPSQEKPLQEQGSNIISMGLTQKQDKDSLGLTNELIVQSPPTKKRACAVLKS